MRSIVRSATLAVIAIAFPTSLTGDEQPKNSKPIVLTEKDDGRTVQVTVGSVLVVRLFSNASTGYRWQPTLSGNPCLQLIRRWNRGDPEPMPGAPSTQAFSYRAVRTGKARLLFYYSRPWEKNPLAEFSVIVAVPR